MVGSSCQSLLHNRSVETLCPLLPQPLILKPAFFSVLNIRHGSLLRSLPVLPDALFLKFLFLTTSKVLSNPYLLKPLALSKELLSRERDNPWRLSIYEHTCIQGTKHNVRCVTLKSISVGFHQYH